MTFQKHNAEPLNAMPPARRPVSMRSKLGLLALPALLLATPLHAQFPGVQGTVEREIQTLGQKKEYAASLVEKGNAAIADKDYESAFSFYKSAVDLLPLGGSASADVRKQALTGFCESGVLLAQQRLAEGRYADARTTVDAVLQEQYDPNYGPALSLRSQILDPTGFADRGTLTPQHVSRIEEVKKLLAEGEGYFASGRYDLAFMRCEQALNIDKYNIAARRLMEKINGAREDYANAAYNETRGDMLAQVAKGWELPVKKFAEGPSAIVEQPSIAIRGTANINDKLNSIIIPRINFTDSSIRESLDFLKKRSIELDETESDPDLKGVNIVLKVPPGSPEENAQITLEIENVPLKAALEYVAQAAGLKIKIDPYAVVVVPSSENTDVLITKEYKVPPNFIQSVPGGTGGTASGTSAAGAIAGRSGARDYLESQGVQFPANASANYVPSTSRLIVKNTQANLDIIDALVETAIATPPTQIEIEAKFLEVNQNNLNELGFDWLLGQFSLAGGSGIYGGGGTEGFGRTINNSAYPLINPGTGLPVGASSATSGPITAGNRGGSGGTYGTAISANALDALLLAGTGGASGVAPGVLSVAGVFTNPQFQVVMRALNQKKGIDLVSAPKVTTQSGKRATIEIIREFRYVAEFDPPTTVTAAGNILTPVAPATPNSFDTKNIGITLEVEPTIGPDGYTIDMQLEPRIIEFDGFINYGSPIFSPVTVFNAIGLLSTAISDTVLLTENVMNKPVFSTREVSTQVSVYDGQTVVMGGLMREDVQKVQDKVPILGDIPLAGRLFRSNVDQHIKKNLIMFVTANLLDPAGQPVIETIEEDELVTGPSAVGMVDEAIPGDPSTIPLPQ
jgi:general secretion pathway protein D